MTATATAETYSVGEEYEEAGVRFRFTEEQKFACLGCSNAEKVYDSFSGVKGHFNLHCPGNPKRAEADAKRVEATQAARAPQRQSKRGQARRGVSRIPSAFEQIRARPGGMSGGPAAYFLNPAGATIREIILINPNGAPVIRNGKDRANSRYNQERQKDKGHEYIGPTISGKAVTRLLEILEANKEDYVLDLQEQIADAQEVVGSADRPEIRDQARKRIAQLSRLLEVALTPVDAAKLTGELDDILKAQKLAALSPAQRDAIAVMFGAEDAARLENLVGLYSRSVSTAELANGGSMSVEITNAGPDEDFV